MNAYMVARMSRARSSGWPALAAIGLLACVGCSDAGGASQEAPITDGQSTNAFPAVGAIYNMRSMSICTGTVIAPRWVLTAGHCLNDDLGDTTIDLAPLSELSYHEGREVDAGDRGIDVEAAFIHPSFGGAAKYDLGLIHLGEDTEGDPMRLAVDPPEEGETVLLLGYGQTDDHRSDRGTKRIAENTVDTVFQQFFTLVGTGDGEGNICDGDSGGPSITDRGEGPVVLGVHTGRTAGGCGLKGYDMRVDTVRGWLEEVTGIDFEDGDEGGGGAGGMP